MRLKFLSACLLLIFLYCGFAGSEARAAGHFVKYLHIAANEGNSSGGHAAIRFDTETFHFQHDSSGILRLQRLDLPAFDHAYTVLGNRPIQESWVEVSADTYGQLLDGFSQALLIQDEQLRILQSRRQDVVLFKLLLNQNQSDSNALQLKGAGYFAAAPGGSSAGEKPAVSQNIINLRSLIKSAYGENFIEERIAAAEAALGAMKLQAAPPQPVTLAADIYPPYSPPASAVYLDAAMALSALQLLQTAPDLAPGSYWAPAADLFRLSPQESLYLTSFAAKLTRDLLNLVNSSRSDWGFPFIAGMARLASIEASVNSGHLTFLDIFPVRQTNMPVTGDRRYLQACKNEAEKQFSLQRQEFFSGSELREADFAALELLGNKFMESEYALAHDIQPRPLPEIPLPARPARLPALPLPAMSRAELQQELAAARTAEKNYAEAVAGLYEYDIFTKNCVTGIFAAINRMMARAAAVNKKTVQTATPAAADAARAESLDRLGGYIDPLQGLNFIPAISAGKVDSSYRVAAQRKIPSYRQTRLAAMESQENALLVFLREANTITSTIYRPNKNDSTFLFFTDDTFLLRPVFGAVNLLAGLGGSLLGLAVTPLDGPDRLYMGGKGILFSLPELFFINLRKGTIDYAAEAGGHF